MAHRGSSSVDLDDFERLYDISDAGQQQQLLDVLEDGAKEIAAGHTDGEDVLKELRDLLRSFGVSKRDSEVDDFVMDSSAYGSERIGYFIKNPNSSDPYDPVIAWLDEDKDFLVTDWGGEYEAWEEAKYLEDPWPRIEEDGPQHGDDAATDDYNTFFAYGDEKQKKGYGSFSLGLDKMLPDEEWGPDDTEDWWFYFHLARLRFEARATEANAAEKDEKKKLKLWWLHHIDSHFWYHRGHGSYDLVHEKDSDDRTAIERAKAQFEQEEFVRKNQGLLNLPPGPPTPGPIWWATRLIQAGKPRTLPRYGDLVIYDLHGLRGDVQMFPIGNRAPWLSFPASYRSQPGMWDQILLAVKNYEYQFLHPTRVWLAQPGDPWSKWVLLDLAKKPTGYGALAGDVIPFPRHKRTPPGGENSWGVLGKDEQWMVYKVTEREARAVYHPAPFAWRLVKNIQTNEIVGSEEYEIVEEK